MPLGSSGVDVLALLSSTLGLGFLSGFRLYATVLVIGCALRFDLFHLQQHYAGLSFLADTRVLIAAGVLTVVEFVADALGDWPMHCHMTHHVMNQMGHTFPNMTGADAAAIDARMAAAGVPGYMTMGHDGMGAMTTMGMPVPENSIPMTGGPGPYGSIDMGGMFTILKVREGITSYEDPGWYQPPEGTLVREATATELSEDGIEV